MLCSRLDWQYAKLRSSTSGAVMCSALVRKMWDATDATKQAARKIYFKDKLPHAKTAPMC